MTNHFLTHSADQVKKITIEWLFAGGLLFDLNRDAIGNEVLFSSNRRRADLLILSEHFHALEIKGELDRLDKLEYQVKDYCRVFDKVSVVITPKYKIETVLNAIPETVGIVRINENGVEVLKNAQVNETLDKFELLKFLPKSILNGLLPGNSRLYADELRDEISRQLCIAKIRETAYQYIRELYKESYQTFLRSIDEYPFFLDDITLLSYYPTDLTVPPRYASELVS